MQQNSSVCSFCSSDSWVILSPIEQSIKQKIEAIGTPLKDWDIQINYGIKTGFNDAFIISTEKRNELLAACKTPDERKRTEELIRPILRGRDIKRYGYEWAGLWIINVHNGIKGKIKPININEYPAIKCHLDYYWDKISTRDDQGVTPYNLRNCAYLEDFDKPKLIYGEISREPKFYLDDSKHFYPEATSFIMVGEHIDYIYTLLLSKPITLFFKLFYAGGGLGEDGYRYKKAFLEKLPIPVFVNSPEQQQLVKLISHKPNYEDEKTNNLVYRLYQLTEKEIEYINS